MKLNENFIKFKYFFIGDYMGEKIIVFILSLLMIVLIAMIPLVIYLEIKQEQYMKEQHCKLVVPEVSETHYIHGTMLVGKVIVPTVQAVTTRLYTCDDGQHML